VSTPIPAPRLSVVVPVYNEEAVLPAFVASTFAALADDDVKLEFVFVNDGSRDRSLERLLELAAAHPEIRVVDLSRNFGKEYALSAGLKYATGDAVVVMDADLQHPPEVIPRFLEQWRAGYDVVYGIHHRRSENSRAKRVLSALFYRFFNRIAETPLPVNVGDFRLMDRSVVAALNELPERNRFMKGLFAWVGFHQVGVFYEQTERALGTSKWSLWRLWNFGLDGLTSFTTVPLRLWSYVGFAVSGSAMIYAAYLVLRTLIHGADVPGFASLAVLILILGGIQLVSLGVMGEYLGRLYREAKGRPLFLVRQTYGFPGGEGARRRPRPPVSGAAEDPQAGERIHEQRHQDGDQ
jgi:polyisoprenyl-phosphate glycosyltransferase